MAGPALVTKDFLRSTISARTRPMVRALGEALFSPDGEATPEKLEHFVDDFDSFISPASKTLRFGLIAMLFILKWSPPFFGRFRTFDEMSVDDRVHHLESLERSNVRQLPLIVVGFKTVMSMLYYETPDELAALGYRSERKRYLLVANGPAPGEAPS